MYMLHNCKREIIIYLVSFWIKISLNVYICITMVVGFVLKRKKDPLWNHISLSYSNESGEISILIKYKCNQSINQWIPLNGLRRLCTCASNVQFTSRTRMAKCLTFLPWDKLSVFSIRSVSELYLGLVFVSIHF